RGPGLWPEGAKRLIDHLAADDVECGIPRRGPEIDEGPAAEDRDRERPDAAPAEPIEGEVRHDPMEPGPKRTLAVVLLPALPRARERVVRGVHGIVRIAEDAVGDSIDLRGVVPVGLVDRPIAQGGIHRHNLRAGAIDRCSPAAAGLRSGQFTRPPGFGPSPRTASTEPSAVRSFAIQSDSLSPTRRTHQASASLRLRATPALTRVSSTSRSRMRRRVMTGTLAVVKGYV